MSMEESLPWDPCAVVSTFLGLSDIAKASPSFGFSSRRAKSFPSDRQDSDDTPVLRVLSELRAKGYRQVCMPLTNERWKTRWEGMCLLPAESTEEDKELAAKDAEAWRMMPRFKKDEVTISRLAEAEGIIAMLSEWLELDSTDDWVRHDAEIALHQELSYAAYLNISTVILPPPRNRDHVASYARTVNACLARSPYISLSVRLPIYNPSIFQPRQSASPTSATTTTPSVVVSSHVQDHVRSGSGPSFNATWEMWDVIRTMCDYNPRLTLTLDLSIALPSTLGVLSKWAAESVRHIYLPSSTFIANMKGYPVLPKPTQQFIRDSMIHQPIIILAGVNEGHHMRGGEMAYSQYVRHLEKTSPAVQVIKKPGTVEHFAKGYQDYLQAPLQPLMDNLACVTYETFEQDPVKYALYEEAMIRAFASRPEGERLVVCIAGAGRGPLVARCFKALARAQREREASVIVVEKNPNAYVTLQQRHAKEWGDKVNLLFGDMRTINIPEKVDIIVSELLGSFGDNELSPECLDGAMRFLKPNGISIPSSYTAHLAPLSSSKLYHEARSSKNERTLETPYVVMFQAVNILSGTKTVENDEEIGNGNGRCGSQVQECWEFEHPRRDAVLNTQGLPFTNSHNARSASLRFWIPHAGILHGLAGYFEAVLYEDIGLSIHPHRKDLVSKDMLSWFPLFFPFRDPLYLPSNSELQVSIWRLTTDRRVWYEWHAESFMAVPISHSAGAAYTTGTEEVAPLSASGMLSPSPSPFIGPPSPLIEAAGLDMLKLMEKGGSPGDVFARSGSVTPNSSEGEFESVKIGHTGLHNPCGRSSWIGL